ncbi:MAG: RNA polymerase sigma factor [Planctomycetaceae bacterium]|jgi:RNA polymerase sigma-70 factor (ECF subfamily)|nr:RNA polymerase sigma factor [Planctomycetaceae bacterium]
MAYNENHAAVIQLLNENVRALTLFARQWETMSVGTNAEDVVQEAFLRLLQEPTFPKSPKAWLYRVVRNLSIDISRRKKEIPQDNLNTRWFEPCQNDDNLTDDLTEALQQLPQEVREIIVAKIWGNLKFREIAELTDRPISSVHHDYQQGIVQLRKRFENEK